MVVVAAACVAPSWALFGRDKKKQEEDAVDSYTRMATDAMREAASPGFDARSALNEIQNNPAVQAKVRAMMQDPAAMAELSKLMQDPAFKSQVDVFASNPEVLAQLQKSGVGAFVNGGGAGGDVGANTPEGARARAQAKAHADMEYEKYSAQFSGEENAATGLKTMMTAARDPSSLADAMTDLNDPEMLKAAQEMMNDPGFQQEMKRMMAQPEMRKIVEASKAYVDEIAKDPAKMREMQAKMAAMTGGHSGFRDTEF